VGGWEDLDRSASTTSLLAFLDEFAAHPGVATAKSQSFDLLAPASGCRLLDAGCGTGADALAFAAGTAGVTVVGVDSSSAAITVAQGRARTPARVEFVQGDLAALPFPAASFDGSRADRSLQHVTRPEVALAELIRVTRPGGAVVVSEASFSLPDARDGPVAIRGELLPFLPLLFKRAGADQIRVRTSSCTIEPGPDVLAVLAAPAGPITITYVHVSAVVASR
jgi:ubiquinone/menaquinone biosynthesis C-methylase UbiE